MVWYLDFFGYDVKFDEGRFGCEFFKFLSGICKNVCIEYFCV